MFNYISLILSFSLINGFTAAIPQKQAIIKPIFSGYFTANNNSISNLNYLSFESEDLPKPVFNNLLVPKVYSTKSSNTLDTKPRVMVRLKNFEKQLEQEVLDKQLEEKLAQQLAEQQRLDDLAQSVKLLNIKKARDAVRAKSFSTPVVNKARQIAPVVVNKTPIVAPVNLAPVAPTDFESYIIAQCNNYGCNSAQMIRIMYCESGGRSNAKNPSGATGLFQFMPATFRANSQRVGISGANIWDPYQQIQVAAWMFANGQSRQWVCK